MRGNFFKNYSKQRVLVLVLICLSVFTSGNALARKASDYFYIPDEKAQEYGIDQVKGFSVFFQQSKKFNSNYSIVTGFSDSSIQTLVMSGVLDKDELFFVLKAGLERYDYKDIYIKENTVPSPSGDKVTLFWVGDRAYETLEEAKSAIDRSLASEAAEEPEVIELVEEKEIEIQVSGSEYPLDIDKKITKLEFGPVNFPEEERFEYMSWSGATYSSAVDISEGTNLLDSGTVSFYSEHRLVMKGLKLPGKESINPYITIVPKLTSESDSWANVLEWGAGLEYRFFENFEWLSNSVWTEWIKSIRFFGEYRKLNFLKDYDPTIPDYDVIVGADIWKRINNPPYDELAKDSILHLIDSEIWGNLTWRETGFNGILGEDYRSFGGVMSYRLLVYWPWITKNMPLETFINMDASATENNFWWENRMRVGAGIGCAPFHVTKFKDNEFLYSLLFWVNYKHTVAYFKDEPEDDVDEGEIIIGISTNINWY